MKIEIATDITPEIYAAMQRLLPQLSESIVIVPIDQMREIVKSGTGHMLLARDNDNNICGILTLTVFRIPAEIRAFIDDVIVDSAARGTGVGRMLTAAAIDIARDLGAGSVNLTTNPARTAANKLYQSMGFFQRDANVYCLRLK